MFKETVCTVDLSDHAVLMDCYTKLNVAFRKQKERIAVLEAALREAYEVYAGSDGFIPETAAEGYQQQIIKQMVDIIGAALEKKDAKQP